ncbi:MAG: hypothetical protein J5I92_09460 [Thiogranum sp.]|nr:hypothetical protein [Thiogranum sp.]
MSLINQMLKDLDARRGSAVNAALAAPQGITVTAHAQSVRLPSARLAAWATGIVLFAGVGFYAMHWWESEPAGTGTFEAVAGAQIPDGRASATAQMTLEAPSPQPVIEELSPAEPEHEDDRIVQSATLAPAAAPSPAPEAVVEPRPIKTITPRQKADRLFAQAERALAAQQGQKGEVLLRQALFEYPRHLSARTRLAALLVGRRNDAAAERLLAQGLAGGNFRLELVKPYAQLLAARDALDEALNTLERVAGQGSADAEWHALRAAILYRMDRHSESADAYQLALQQRPAEALWWTGLAIAREHNLQPREALHAYRRAAGLQLTSAVRDYVNQRVKALQTTDGL